MVETQEKSRNYLLPKDIVLKDHINSNPKASGFFSDINQDQYNKLQEWKEMLKNENLVTDWETNHDLFLLRFMRARKFEVKKVHEMFVAYLKWFEDNDVKNIEKWEFTEQLSIKEVYPHGYHKTDNQGRPIYIEIISQCNIDEVLKRSNEERMMKYYVKEYERVLRYRFDCCGIKAGKIIEQSCTIICANGLGISALTGKVKRFMDLASKIGQNYYPEMLGNMYIINAGFFFSAVWAIAKTFVDEKTAKKIQVLKTDYLKEFEKILNVEQLPKVLGGKCECKEIKGGCLYADIGPWNPDGGLELKYSEELFDKVK